MAKKDIKKEAKETAIIIEDALRSIASRIGDIFAEALDETNTVAEALAKDVKSSLNSLAKVSNELATSYQKAYEGAYKQADLQKTINARKAKEFAIQAKIEAATRNINTSEEDRKELLKKLNAELEEAVGYNKDLEKSLQKQVDISKNINKAMGFTGGALKGLQKLAGGLGLDNLEDVFADAKSASMEMAKQVSNDGEKQVGLFGKMKVAAEGVSVALSGIGQALMDPLVVIGLIIKSIKFLVSIFDHVLKLTNQIGQGFGVAGAEAAALKAEIHAAGDASGNMFYFTEELFAAQMSLNQAVGQNLKFNEKNAKVFQDMTLYMGLSTEQAGKLFKLSAESGVPFENIYDNVVGTTQALNEGSDFAMSTSDAISAISGSSASVRFNIKGGTEGLVRAAHTAARLGTTMDEIAASAATHLDFESSIAKEIEAEMFLQKDLNLDRLRAASLAGDTETMAKEQARLIKENMGSLEGNVLAQQAFADSLGISTEQLAEQMMKQKELKGLSGEQLKAKLAEQDAMVEAGQDAATFDRSMASAVKQLKAALEPLAKTIGPAFLAIAQTIVPMVTPILKFLGSNTGKILLGVAGAFYAIKGAKSLFGKMFGGIMERGATPANPQFVYNVNESGGGSASRDVASQILGNRNILGGKIFKGLSKVVGGKNTFVGRQLRNLAAMNLKRSSFMNQVVANNKTLSKLVPSMSKLTSNISSTSKVATGVSGTTKVASGLAKTMKVLGPLGAVLDLGVGGFTGASQANMGAEEQKLAGVKQGIGKGEGAVLGALTGGAEKGSVFTDMLGGEKGSAGDEALGVGMAAGRGALVGGAIGSVVPVVGTAVGAAVGAVVGTVAEGFKVLTNPDSSIRQGISSFASATGETLTSAFNKSKDALTNFAKTSTETLTSAFNKSKESMFAFAKGSAETLGALGSGAMKMGKQALGFVGGKVSGAVSSVGGAISSGVGAIGNFFGFAKGGIVTKPVAGIVGEAGPEAVIPLNQAQNVLGGGGEVVALLKVLISEVRKGGDVYLDGNKVGYSLALQSSQMG
jgi:hypothetical protein